MLSGVGSGRPWRWCTAMTLRAYPASEIESISFRRR